MADKIMYIKAINGDQVETMNIPVFETSRAIDVCQNLYKKFMFLRAQGYRDIEAIYGYPITCPTCGALVDVDPTLEGFQKYCKVHETEAINLVMFEHIKNA